jgi:hypothetical protein
LARTKLAALSALILFSTFALAEGTRTWEQSKFDELIKGTPNGVALRSEGGLELAPAFKALATTPPTLPAPSMPRLALRRAFIA